MTKLFKKEMMPSIIQRIRDAFEDKPVVFDLFLITVAYTIAHGLMFFNHGVFWDDWFIYHADPALTIDRLRQMGTVWVAYLSLLVSSGGISAFRVIAFGSYLLAAWCLFGIAREMNIDRHTRFWVVLLFALFPVNSFRLTMCIMLYNLCYFLFFLGFWLTALFVRTRNIWYRIAALVLLFMSFTTNSLLVFYSLVLLFLVYRERPAQRSISVWLKLAARYADYLLLPILYWVVKSTFMKPYGLFAGYNQVKLTGLKTALHNTLLTFDTSFLTVIDRSIGRQTCSQIFHKLADRSILLPFGLLMVIITLLFGIKAVWKKVDRESWRTLWFFLLGFCAFGLAAFPYAAVGKLPQFLEMETRHQLLLPLGAALLLVYGVKLFSRHKAVMVPAYLLLSVLFINVDIKDYLSLQRDWYKQLSIIQNMRLLPVMYYRTSFLFLDRARDLNFNRHEYVFYEYAALMKAAFGNEKRFGDDLRSNLKEGRNMAHFRNRHLLNSYYLMGEFVPQEPDTFIQISSGTTDVSTAGILQLIVWEHFNSEKFTPALFNIVHLAPLSG